MKRIALAIMLLVGVSGVVMAPSAQADEQYCSDGITQPGGGTETVIIGNHPGDPFTLAVQTTPRSGALTQVILCYGTGPAGATNMLAAGSVHLDTYNYGTQGAQGYVYCHGDATATVSPDCRYDYGATSPASITPTYGASGVTLTATVPFTICAGSCISDTSTLRQTGAIVGTLAPVAGPSGSTGAGYRLTALELWLNGTRVTGFGSVNLGGAYVDYNLPGLTLPSTSSSTPPCITGGVCMPTGMLGVTGATQTVTLFLPTGTTTVPVTIPTKCIVNFSGPC